MLPERLLELIDATYSKERFFAGMSAEDCLKRAAFEAGMREAAHQLLMIQRLQSRPKDADGRPEQRSTHRWPPAGTKPGRGTD